MSAALEQLIPLGLAAAVVPTWTSQVIILLATDRPLVNALAFVLGNFTARMSIGIATLFVLSPATVKKLVEANETMPGWVRIAFGAILLGIGVLLVVTRPRATSAEPPGWLQALEHIPPWLCFVWGFANMLLPGAQYVFFLSGLAEIAGASLSAAGELTLLALFSAAVQVMPVTPIVIYLALRREADRVLVNLRDWLARNGNVLVGCILLVGGGIAVAQGALAL